MAVRSVVSVQFNTVMVLISWLTPKQRQHQNKFEHFSVRVHTVTAHRVAEQPRLLHRRLDGGEELYYTQAMVEPYIQCLIQQVPAMQRH